MARMFPGDDGTQPEIEIPDDPSEAWRKIREEVEGSDEDEVSDE